MVKYTTETECGRDWPDMAGYGGEILLEGA